jgi:hypothetical protein
MLLTTRALAAMLALALAGCDRFETAAPAPASASAVATAGDEETLRLARPAKESALACARTCVIHAPSFQDAADACNPDAATVKALADAAAALEAHAGAHPAEVRGPAAAFAGAAQLFADWVVKGVSLGRTRGTLRLFQDVAEAWNAYRPGEPIPVDPVDEYRRYGFGSKGYIMRPLQKTAGKAVWKSCYDGPCLWEDHY